MRKLILRVSVSIDGFMDTAEGKLDFARSRSPEGMAWVAEKMGQAGAHLLRRKAFAQMASFWPTASGPNAKAMNEIPKIVFSKKGFDPAQVTSAAGWADSQVMTGDLAASIAKLKAQPGKDLMAHGGIELAQGLVQAGVVDEYCMAVHPVAAGKGFALFEKLGEPLHLQLVETKVFPTGAMIQVFRPA